MLRGNEGDVLTRRLKPMPSTSPSDIYLVQQMMDLKLIPYQSIPDAPGKPVHEIRVLGKRYFPFTAYSAELAYSVYDWTSPSFVRNLLFKFFAYTGIVDKPLDRRTIANVIWTSDWLPFTPRDVDYMRSFLMTPADSEDNVRSQLSVVHEQLHAYSEAQNNILRNAFYAMPRTSVRKVPQLFSGQPDISNLELYHFAPQFCEFPGNAGPTDLPMRMPFEEALQMIFKVNNTITTKAITSFTEYRHHAMKYSNGILLVLNPPPGAVIWEKASYITPLSDDPGKNEYTLTPGCELLIQRVHRATFSGKQVWVFTMMITS